MVYVIVILAIFALAAMVAVGWSSVLIVGAAAAIAYAYYYFGNKAEKNGVAPGWQLELYKFLPWFFMVVGGLIAFVGIVWFFVGIGGGEDYYSADVCAWCNGFGCSHCEEFGFYIFTKTRYDNYNFAYGLLFGLIGACFALLGYHTRNFTKGIATKETEPKKKKELTADQKRVLKKMGVIAAATAAGVAVVVLLVNWLIVPPVMYNKAKKYEQAGDGLRAAVTYGELGDYKDARERSWKLWQTYADRKTFDVDECVIAVKDDGTVITEGWDGRKLHWEGIVSVDAGSGYVLGLREDGTVASEVVKANVNYEASADVDAWTDIVAIAAGDHTLGLKYDGTVVAAGRILKGNAPKGDLSKVASWEHIVDICVGGNHAVGLKADGRVVAVGNNEDNQCQVSEWRGVVDVAAGYNFTVGLKADGTVLMTQSASAKTEDFGQFEAKNWTQIVAIDADSYHVVGLKRDGSVVYCGKGENLVADWKNMVAISTGNGYLGMNAEGKLLSSWTLTGTGWDQIKTPNGVTIDETGMAAQNYARAEQLLQDGDAMAAAIAFGKAAGYQDAQKRSFALWDTIADRQTIVCDAEVSVALKADGTVVCTGAAFPKAAQWKDIIAVSMGCDDLFGLKADGTVVCAKDSYDLSGWTNVVAISACYNHVVGLRADGTAVAAGKDGAQYCALNDWENIVAVSTGDRLTVGLRADGTVVSAGEENDRRCAVSGWENVIAVECSGRVTFGICEDGSVLTASEHSGFGEDVRNWRYITDVSACFWETVGLNRDGTVVYTDTDSDSAAEAYGWNDVASVCASDKHILALRTDGTVVAMGENELGQCDVSGWTGIAVPKEKTAFCERIYQNALAAFQNKQYNEAASGFIMLGDYQDAKAYLSKLEMTKEQTTKSTTEKGAYSATSVVYQYDAYGNVVENGVERVYEDGRLVKEISKDGERIYRDGRIWSEDFKNWTLEKKWEHDEQGRLIREEVKITWKNGTAPQAYTYEFEYDAAGQLIREILDNPSIKKHCVTEYTYRNGRVIKTVQTEGTQVTVTYHVYAMDGMLMQERNYKQSGENELVLVDTVNYNHQITYSLKQ